MKKAIVAAIALALTSLAQAQTSINLSNYTLKSTRLIDPLGDLGLEASAVTYARDRGSLFFVGDEGLGVVEISRTGTTLGTMAFDWTSTGSTNNDAEGLTYLGNGELVVVDERPQIAYRFSFSAGATVVLNNQPKVALTGSTLSVGNLGTEGISVDPRDGRFFSVKQDNPVELRVSALSFAVGFGTAATSTLFSGAANLFGLNSLSDVQTLSPIDALNGQPAVDNLLLLSLDSNKLLEVNQTGTTLSSFDLAPLNVGGIEGVTVDEKGLIYLVAEGDSVTNPSRLIVLAPVPEPEQYLLILVGLAALGLRIRSKSRAEIVYRCGLRS